LRRAHSIDLDALTNEIGDQAHVAGAIFARQHQALLDRFNLLEHGLDFSRLDAVTTQLDLMIDAAEVFEHSILAPTDLITGAVEPFAWPERRRHETFGGQFGAVQVTPRQAGATDIKLAWYADRGQIAMGVQDMTYRV
jgi:hypothetical protein